MALLGGALLVVALLGKGVQKDRSDIRNRRFYWILCLQKIKNFCYLCVFCPFVSLSPQKAFFFVVIALLGQGVQKDRSDKRYY